MRHFRGRSERATGACLKAREDGERARTMSAVETSARRGVRGRAGGIEGRAGTRGRGDAEALRVLPDGSDSGEEVEGFEAVWPLDRLPD